MARRSTIHLKEPYHLGMVPKTRELEDMPEEGLAELTAENDALVARAEAKRKASLRRLQRRIRTQISGWGGQDPKADRNLMTFVNHAIREWDKAERKRGGW